MDNIFLVDKAFSSNKASVCHLSVQFGLNGYAFCILDKKEKKYVALKSRQPGVESSAELSTLVQNALNTEELLGLRYNTVSVLHVSRKSALVPDLYFDASHARNYFQANNVLDSGDELVVSKISAINSFNVFSIPARLKTLLDQKFAKMKLHHQADPFLTHAANLTLQPKKGKASGPVVVVNDNDGFFDIAVFNGGNLLMYNNFAYNDSNEFAYFVLFVYRQMNLQPDNVEAVFSGTVEKKSYNYETVRKYLKYTSFLSIAPVYSVQLFEKEIALWPYSNLFHVWQCE